MRRIELSPEKAAIVDKQVDKIRSTISYAVKRSGRTSGGDKPYGWPIERSGREFRERV